MDNERLLETRAACYCGAAESEWAYIGEALPRLPRLVLRLQKVSGDELEIQMREDQTVQELKKKVAKKRKSTCNRHRLIVENKD